MTGSLSGLVPFAPEYRKFLKFPVFSQLAGNLAIQRRVRAPSTITPESRSPPLLPRLGGLGVGDHLARLVRLQLRLLQRDLRGALRRARLVDLLRGDEAGPEQRLHPRQCARSESTPVTREWGRESARPQNVAVRAS